jgi:hypothetical protein
MKDYSSIPPSLSVVVAAWSGTAALRLCLRSLYSQIRSGDDEIIVARNFDIDLGVSLLEEFPALVDLPLAFDVTVPRLRAAGMAVASGVIVAFIEDHCVCSSGWRNAIVKAHELPFEAVGGPVDLARGGRPLDWAVYFYDYSRFAPPMISAPALSLSGANMSYKGTLLRGLGANLQHGVMEVILERELRRRGVVNYIAADAIVIHSKRHSIRNAIGLAYALARGYAAQRVLGAAATRRVTYSCVTPLLPFLLGGRILAATILKRRKILQLALALPWLAVLLIAWSLGELAGYLAGEGYSQRRWR